MSRVTFPNVTVVRAPEQDEGPVTIHAAWYVIAGEYADEPDAAIRVEHCVDEDGNDQSEWLANVVAKTLREVSR